MKHKINIAIIGMGKHGQYILSKINFCKNVNIKYICCRKNNKLEFDGYNIIFDDNIIMSDFSLDALIIATQPSKHFDLAYRFLGTGKKVFIEKPLTLNPNECSSLINLCNRNSSSGIMVGNKLLYSEALNKLKSFIANNNISICSISSYWLKSSGLKKYGVFFDLAYHHVMFCNFLFDKPYDKIIAYPLTKTGGVISSGILILYYSNIPIIVEVSYNNHYHNYNHSFRIETDKGIFIAHEKKRAFNIKFDNLANSDLSFLYTEKNDVSIQEELITFFDWVQNKKILKNTLHEDLQLINDLSNIT